jgi:hypothetical protein
VRPTLRRYQRGQALLVVLLFLAIFLVVLWASLTLAGGALLGQASVSTDTRETYALDSGVDWAIQNIDLKNGNGCNAPSPTFLVLTYPNQTITVTVTIGKPTPCHAGAGANFDVTVSATGTSKTLKAHIVDVAGNGIAGISWESYQ